MSKAGRRTGLVAVATAACLALAAPAGAAIGPPRRGHPGSNRLPITETFGTWNDNVTTGHVRIGYSITNPNTAARTVRCQVILWIDVPSKYATTSWTVDFAQTVKVGTASTRYVWDAWTWQGNVYDVTVEACLARP